MHIVDIHKGDIKIHVYMLVIESLGNWYDGGRGLGEKPLSFYGLLPGDKINTFCTHINKNHSDNLIAHTHTHTHSSNTQSVIV